MSLSPNRRQASSDSHTSTTRKPLSPCPAAWTNRPSTGQSAGDSRRLLPPVSLRTLSSYVSCVTPDPWKTATTGIAAPTWADLEDELESALGEDRFAAFETLAVLVSDAERLLVDEPSRLPELLEMLYAETRRHTLRVIFQARELPPDTLALFREYEVARIG